MTTTARFGFALSDALTPHDKEVLDSILAALETHDHKGGTRLADPAAVPTGVLTVTGGQLPAGQTFYYRVSYLDKYGLETAASPEFSVTTPLGIAPADPPVVTGVTGGTLPMGVTYYALSVLDVDGNETRLSTPTPITITDFKTARISAMNLDVAAVRVGIWRQGPLSGGFYTRVATVPIASLPYNDTGAVVDDEDADTLLLPSTNATNATSKVLVTVPEPLVVGADPSLVKAWRLYRSLQSGAYGPNSLVAEVRTTVNPDGTGGVLTSYLDDGTQVLRLGTPLARSQTLIPSVKIVSGGGGGAVLLPTTAGTPYRLVTAADGTLVTRPSPGGTVDPAAGNTFLVSQNGTAYKLSINDSGGLVTLATHPGSGDNVYLYPDGPLLPSPDPTVSYKLGVADDGSLTTVEV